jgi:hypothetical protein
MNYLIVPSVVAVPTDAVWTYSNNLGQSIYETTRDFLDFLTLEDWADKLSRNVGRELSLNSA